MKSAVLAVIVLLVAAGLGSASSPVVRVLTLNGTVEPAVAEYLDQGISKAEEDGVAAVVVLMDTPGGGMEPMQRIVKSFLNARIPVIVYVAPEGAWAGSAGVFIAMAANVAAMAPGTNIGSAHPVSAFPTEGGESGESKVRESKAVNHAAKYIVSIANRRGRNAEWAEKAVRESANLTCTEAVKMKVVDFIAKDLDEVLAKADGRRVETAEGEVIIRTKGAKVENVPMPWNKLLLHYLGNPLVAYFLMLAAIYGIIFEINNPGATVPGVIGGISVILLLYSFSVIPTNLAGLLLVVLAIGLFIADIKLPTHGVLTVGGAIAFFLGSLMVFGSKGSGVSAATIAAGTAATVLFFVLLVGMGAAALRKPVVTGKQGLIGRVVTAETDIAPSGKIFTEGSWWTAETEGEHISKGERVKIVGVDGLKVKVVREESSPAGEH